MQKNKFFGILIFILVLFSSFVISWTPPSDADFRYFYDLYNVSNMTAIDIYVSGTIFGELSGSFTIGSNVNYNGYSLFNATSVNATSIYQNGNLVLDTSSVLTANSSLYWDNLNTPVDINTGDLTDDGTYLRQSNLSNTSPIGLSGSTYSLIPCSNGQVYLYNSSLGGWVCSSAAGGGGVTDHELLNNLDYDSAGHIGFARISDAAGWTNTSTTTKTDLNVIINNSFEINHTSTSVDKVIFKISSGINNVVTQLFARGIQRWDLTNNASVYKGSIQYSTPGDNPGISFRGATELGRTDINLHSQSGGLSFSTGVNNTRIPSQMLLTTDGNFGIGTTDPVGKLNVIGTINATENITAPFFIGDLTGNADSATFWSSVSSFQTRWFSDLVNVLTFNENLMNSTIDSKIAATSATYLPTSFSVPTGTLDGGVLSDLFSIDSLTVNISEVVGVPGIDVRVNFTNVTSFNQIVIYQFYDGSLSHTIHLKLWNYVTKAWDSYVTFTDEGDFVSVVGFVPMDDNYINTTDDNKVQLRFDHDNSGDTGHNLFIDMAVLELSGTGGSSLSGSGTSGKIPLWIDTQSLADSIITQTGTTKITVDGDLFADNMYNKTSSTEVFGSWTNISTLTTTTLSAKVEGDILIGNSDADHYVYFYEDGSETGEYILWDNTDDRFYISDSLSVGSIISSGSVTGTQIVATADIYTTGTGDDLRLGSSTPGSANVELNESGDAYFKNDVSLDSMTFHDGNNTCIFFNGSAIILNNNADGVTCP